jgi:peptidoglycan/LPS O-acetylase OafA/YrhL
MRSSARPELTFRPEIEGLRAVAALLVASYHVWLGRVSGGVDVFFVVSGYLVTRSLLGQQERDGRLDLGGFWKRLLRRLLPASFFVLLAVTLGTLLLLPRVLWLDTSQQVLASALYVENWLLALNSVDYLARNALQSPVQHFWALSVQGQFYLAWPLTIAVLLMAARPRKIGSRQLLAAAILLLLASSFAYSVIITASDQRWAYFDSLARLWEFAIGALLAITAFRPVLPPAIAALLGWLALAAIVSCGAVIRGAQSFPGYAALWPTMAAAVILLLGSSGGRYGVHRLLASKPLVAIGGISYAIYLWHWVLLIFFLRITFAREATAGEGLLILIATLALSLVTVRLIETPIRSGRVLAGSTATAAGAFALLLFGGLCFSITAAHSDRSILTARVDMLTHPGAIARLPGFSDPVPADVPILPQPIYARADDGREDRGECAGAIKGQAPFACRVGSGRPARIIAIAGASHAGQYMPALARLARERGWAAVDFTVPGCGWRAGRGSGPCEGTSERVTREVMALRPDLVVTTSNTKGGQEVPPSWAALWQFVTDMGIPILAIRDNPIFAFDVPFCVEHHGAQSSACSVRRAEEFGGTSPEASFGQGNERIHFLDLTDFFCDSEICPAVIGNILVYRDDDHITATYARTLAPMIGARIDGIFESR